MPNPPVLLCGSQKLLHLFSFPNPCPLLGYSAPKRFILEALAFRLQIEVSDMGLHVVPSYIVADKLRPPTIMSHAERNVLPILRSLVHLHLLGLHLKASIRNEHIRYGVVANTTG